MHIIFFILFYPILKDVFTELIMKKKMKTVLNIQQVLMLKPGGHWFFQARIHYILHQLFNFKKIFLISLFVPLTLWIYT